MIRVKLDQYAFVPVRAHEYDAGLDIKTPRSFMLHPGCSEIINTGVHVEIPEGYVGLLKSRSGLNTVHGIVSEGVIDAGYTGSIKVKLYNHSTRTYGFKAGDKITQLVIVPCLVEPIEVVDKLDDTERGDNGFGSTGR